MNNVQAAIVVWCAIFIAVTGFTFLAVILSHLSRIRLLVEMAVRSEMATSWERKQKKQEEED